MQRKPDFGSGAWENMSYPSAQRQPSLSLAPHARQSAGRALIILASLALAAIAFAQALGAANIIAAPFDTWRPMLYAYLLWSIALGAAQVLIKGEQGHKAQFILPAVLFTLAMVIFPTFFGLYIAFTDWNLCR